MVSLPLPPSSVIQTFKYQTYDLFYNQQNGTNALDFNDDQLYDMQEKNYRRIEYKLKKKRYIRFTAEVVEELIEMVGKSIYNDSNHYSKYKKEELENVFDYLQDLYPDFFHHQEPQPSDLRQKSFFEKKLDAGELKWDLNTYIEFKDLDPDEIDEELEERYYTAYKRYIKKKL